jgi:hypothetical protein
MINYSKLQIATKKALVTFGAVPVIVRFLDNSTISTIGVFTDGKATNIDPNNPTHITGETTRKVLVPGIDFFNAATNTTKTPQVEGTVEWTQNMVLFKKDISSVMKEEPLPNTPILYTLEIE